VKASDAELDGCWNAMLLDIPVEKIKLLQDLKTKYKTFLLSNTNSIHLESFTRRLQVDHRLNNLDELFHRVYYSQLLGMRKPDVEIYKYVLEKNGLKSDETIFLDDNPDNIQGAARAGIHTFFVGHPDDVYKLFK
jgi:putative hydrolase of the HAD superfamily